MRKKNQHTAVAIGGAHVPFVQVRDLGFRYSQNKEFTFEHVSFAIERGDVVTILGPNGSGKSTLLNCVANLAEPTTGEILVDGKPLKETPLKEFAQKVAYVQQNHTPVFNYTVEQFVTMGRAAHIGMFQKPSLQDKRVVYESLERLGIFHLKDKPYTRVSGGERQQAMIARALAQEPEMLLLDEPTAHLDVGNQLRVLKLIRGIAKEGYSVVMTAHDPNHAIMIGGKVAILNRVGDLNFGTCQESLTEAALAKLYNADVKVVYVNEVHRDTVIGNLDDE